MKGFCFFSGKRLRPLGSVLALVHHDLERQHLQLLPDEGPSFFRLVPVVMVEVEVEAEAEVVVVLFVVLVSGLHFCGQRVLDVVAARAAGEAGKQPVKRIEAVHPDGQEVPRPQEFGQTLRPRNQITEVKKS